MVPAGEILCFHRAVINPKVLDCQPTASALSHSPAAFCIGIFTCSHLHPPAVSSSSPRVASPESKFLPVSSPSPSSCFPLAEAALGAIS